MRIGSLFAGIGGFDLAARWVGWETAWYSEIDPYASAVMRKNFPDAPNHGDIRNIKGDQIEKVDILCGGFPCQDISVARNASGTADGIEGERSGLWKEYARLIGELRPRYVFAENVTALRSRGLDVVLQDLNALGYDAEWHCIPASYIGARHRRDRIWIIASPNTGSERIPTLGNYGRKLRQPIETQFSGLSRDTAQPWLALDGDSRSLRSGDGLSISPHRARLKACGNAIVPQVAYTIFLAIKCLDTMPSPDYCDTPTTDETENND